MAVRDKQFIFNTQRSGNFGSPRDDVIFLLSYKTLGIENEVCGDFRFRKISKHFSKTSENVPELVQRQKERF